MSAFGIGVVDFAVQLPVAAFGELSFTLPLYCLLLPPPVGVNCPLKLKVVPLMLIENVSVCPWLLGVIDWLAFVLVGVYEKVSTGGVPVFEMYSVPLGLGVNPVTVDV